MTATVMAAPCFKIEFPDLEAFTREVEGNLSQGGAFARGADGVAEGDDCEVVLVHPGTGSELKFPARVVMVIAAGEGKGVGVAIDGFTPETRSALREFLNEPPPVKRNKPPSVHERLRGLSVAHQLKIAREGEINERTVLERMYGKAVWEGLLRNPRLSPPEVARIARMGTAPKPLLELIVGNPAWLSSPQVRRALLGNRRLSRDMIMKVLRATPKGELKLVPKQTAYPASVRDVARKLLK